MEKEEIPAGGLTERAGGAGPASPPVDQVPELKAPGFRTMMALLARQLGKNLDALVVPVGMITAVLVTLCGTVSLQLLREDVFLAVGQLAPFEPTRKLAGIAAVMALVFASAHLGMVAMVVVMVAGSLLGRPVSVGGALRRVMRRSGALLVLLVMFVGVMATLLVAVGYAVARTESVWAGVIVAGLVALLLWRLPLTVPVVMLESAGPFKAYIRARDITWDRRTRMFVRLMVTVAVLPLVPGACASWLVTQFTGIGHSVAEVVAATVFGALSAVLQGAGLAVVALDQWRPNDPRSARSPSELSFDFWPVMSLRPVASQLPARIPGSSPRRVRALLLMALTLPMLVAPGFLYQGYLQFNPHRLPAIQEQPILNTDPVLLNDGSLMAREEEWDLDEPRLCSDRKCTHTNSLPILPQDLGVNPRLAHLPDGSRVVAGWMWDEHDKADQLKLVRCTVLGCTAPDQAPTATKAASQFNDVGVAASERGTLLAALIESRNQNHPATVRLLRCSGRPCEESRLLAEFEVHTSSAFAGVEPIAVTAGAQGRPIVTFEDDDTGAITLLSCNDPDCRDFVIRRPVAPASAPITENRPKQGYFGEVDIIVPPDDHPVLVHRDVTTGFSRLLRCRTPDCAAVDARTLTERISSDAPAMVLGPDGLPLIATFDMPRKRAILIACDVPDCSLHDTVDLGAFSAYSGELDIAVGRDGRPRVLWINRDVGRYPHQDTTSYTGYLLTCLEARCGA
jgi:hypothetical protein